MVHIKDSLPIIEKSSPKHGSGGFSLSLSEWFFAIICMMSHCFTQMSLYEADGDGDNSDVQFGDRASQDAESVD